jgi:hypothetical protein
MRFSLHTILEDQWLLNFKGRPGFAAPMLDAANRTANPTANEITGLPLDKKPLDLCRYYPSR